MGVPEGAWGSSPAAHADDGGFLVLSHDDSAWHDEQWQHERDRWPGRALDADAARVQ